MQGPIRGNVKPSDRIPEWPEQAACMRMQRCMDLLSQILPDAQYKAVRTSVAQWDIADDIKAEREAMAESVRRSWEQRKAG